MRRSEERGPADLRKVTFIPDFTRYAEGSVLCCFGETKVLCNVSVLDKVPSFLAGTGEGWVTAEYQLLPRSTHTRTEREVSRGRQGGRTLEIQRLIGRSLRGVVDRKVLGERTLMVDCDVLQADGGTRTASITGGFVALSMAVERLLRQGCIAANPVKENVAAVSCGVVGGELLLDLDYAEDSEACVDMNLVMTSSGRIVEIQGTCEGDEPFSREVLSRLVDMGAAGIERLVALQNELLERWRSAGLES